VKLRYLFSILLIAFMMGAAEWSGNTEIIFPETAALCLGFWVIDKTVWHVSRPKLLILLILMAIVGTALQKWSTLPFSANVCIAFSIAAFALTIAKCSSYPVISAAILPLVVRSGSWAYPVTVAILALLLCLGQYLMEKGHLREKREYQPITESISVSLHKWIPLLFIVMTVALIADTTNRRFLILPPLIVTLVEFTAVNSGIRKHPWMIIFLIFSAALLGTGAQLLADSFGLSTTVCFTIALSLLFTIFELVGRRFAPAAAILLIPSLVPVTELTLFPVWATLGAILFIFLSMLLFKGKVYRHKR